METSLVMSSLSALCVSSYRTYEEWKRQALSSFKGRHKVLTVPMRNGNINGRKVSDWRRLVLTVPMRNGNKAAQEKLEKEAGEFLPYLWGMETQGLNFCLPFVRFSSYRTYEEWKLLHFFLGSEVIHCSYRTYEEWKPSLSRVSISSTIEFLPYLWGMETLLNSSVVRWVIKFLPYLWGMETAIREIWNMCSIGSYRTYEEWKHVSNLILFPSFFCVLTVPMRNGN